MKDRIAARAVLAEVLPQPPRDGLVVFRQHGIFKSQPHRPVVGLSCGFDDVSRILQERRREDLVLGVLALLAPPLETEDPNLGVQVVLEHLEIPVDIKGKVGA